MMLPIDQFEIAISESLVGAKKAVKSGRKIYISPAMYDLMKNSTGKELEHLLANLLVVDVGEPFNIFEPLPMTTKPDMENDIIRSIIFGAFRK
jgi:hypothetical protein